MELAAREVAKSKQPSVERTFRVAGSDNEFYVVKIERKRTFEISESRHLKSNSTTISAMPPGSTCGCCGGTGRSS